MAGRTVEANLFASWLPYRGAGVSANPFRSAGTAAASVEPHAAPTDFAQAPPSVGRPRRLTVAAAAATAKPLEGISFVAKDGLDRAVAAGDAAAVHLRLLLQKVSSVVADLTQHRAVHDSLPFAPAQGEPDSCASMVGRALYGRSTTFELDAFARSWLRAAADLSARVAAKPNNFAADVDTYLRQQVQAVRTAAQQLKLRQMGQLGQTYQSPLGPRDPGPFNGGHEVAIGASDYAKAFASP
jgi:hypothetical protein